MNYRVGQRLDGVINNVTDLGIFVTLPKHKSGLIHHSDFGDDWPRERQRWQAGDQVRVVIQNLRKGRLDLSLRRVNDPDLQDPTNQFSSLKPRDFASVLNRVDQEAQTEIKQLEAALN
ncbi:30S ribosomal protein S1 [Lactobacillus nasalidis]|uniref:30S ribosomal protein S1 n=1 Tax=Lactobacillus nasalidis TaxID=2797258 RepID=A0ABQ3W9R4_9LACO|nr:S1 RNA-binding domain-containing protein [Lactobacillus nasalidis]GHV98293.1 30S ribosomal protein S1 [Lactobacillus nasalidis]GHV98983.1 30S ribosomal protein S1 [Lactobacillus nasalidis]GHW01622.1 30S ribosomal protein S1 [Lactobacillus nasalidis]